MNIRHALFVLISTAVSTACMADDESTDPHIKTVLPLKKISVTLEYQKKACAASLSLEYYQKDSSAHVKSTLKNEACAASSGSYVIRVRYLPDDGEMSTVEFEETWSRDDDRNVFTEKDYYIGEDLWIRRVSSARLKCECTEPQSVEPSADSEAPRDEAGAKDLR